MINFIIPMLMIFKIILFKYIILDFIKIHFHLFEY